MKITKYGDIIKYVELEDSTRWTISYVDISRAPYHFNLHADTDVFYQSDTLNYFDVTKVYYDTADISDITILKFDSNRIFEHSFEQSDINYFDVKSIQTDLFEQSDNQILKFDSNRIFDDTVNIPDENKKNIGIQIYNPSIQDYAEESYFEWIANNELNYQFIYNNTPGTPYSYSAQDYFNLKPTKGIVDTVTIPDSSYTIFNAIRIYNETFTPEDITSFVFNAIRSYTDTTTILDITELNIKPILSDTANSSDNISLTPKPVLLDNYTQTDNNYFNIKPFVQDTTEQLDYYSFNINQIQSDSFTINDIFSSNTNSTQSDSFTEIDSILLNTKPLFIDSFNQTDSTLSNLRTTIYNVTIQDYAEESYFEWKTNNIQDYRFIYNNTPGTPYSYSTQETIQLYLNGSLIT